MLENGKEVVVSVCSMDHVVHHPEHLNGVSEKRVKGKNKTTHCISIVNSSTKCRGFPNSENLVAILDNRILTEATPCRH